MAEGRSPVLIRHHVLHFFAVFFSLLFLYLRKNTHVRKCLSEELLLHSMAFFIRVSSIIFSSERPFYLFIYINDLGH